MSTGPPRLPDEPPPGRISGSSDAPHGGAAPRRWFRPGPRTIFVLAACTSFLLYLHRYTWNLVRPELELEYRLSNTQLEAIGSAFFFPYALGQVPCGVLCDLFGPHLFLVAVIFAWSLLLPLHGMTGSFAALLAIRGGFGLAQAGCYPALSQVTRHWFSPRRRTQVQGLVASAFGRGGGAMASIIMGGLLMSQLGLSWRAALLAMSLVGVLFALLFLVLFRNTPEPPDRPLSETPASPTPADALPRVLPWRFVLRNRSYTIMLGQQFLNAGSDAIFVLILGSYFRSLGVDSGGHLGLLISLPLWGGALGGIFGGWANDWALHHFSARRWCRAGVAGVGLGIGGVTVISTALLLSDPVAIAVGLMIARFFTDWNQPTVWGTCTDIGGRYTATVFGITNMTGNMGAFLTPVPIGMLLDWFSRFEEVGGEMIRQTNYAPAFVVCGGMMLAAAAGWMFVDCTRTITPDDPSAASPAPSA